MGRIALFWLVLTPLWIAFSFYASTSKVAFIPPALVVVAVALYWLHNRFVVLVAGEHEPRAELRLSQGSSQGSHFRPVSAAALSRLRPALIAIGAGACIGAIATSIVLFDRPLYERAVANKSTAALATQPNAMIDVRPKAVQPQSFSAEQKTQGNSGVASSDHPENKQAAVQSQTLGQSPIDQPRCNVSLCESSYQSFRASDCTYQPYSGPRQYCAR